MRLSPCQSLYQGKMMLVENREVFLRQRYSHCPIVFSFLDFNLQYNLVKHCIHFLMIACQTTRFYGQTLGLEFDVQCAKCGVGIPRWCVQAHERFHDSE